MAAGSSLLLADHQGAQTLELPMPQEFPIELGHEVFYSHDRNGNIKVDPLSLLTDPEFLRQVEAANQMAARVADAKKAIEAVPQIDPAIALLMAEIQRLQATVEELRKKADDAA